MSRYIDADKAIAMFKEAQEKTNNIVEITSLIGSMAVIDSCKTEDVAPVIHARWIEKIEIKPKQGIKYPVVGCLNCGTVFCDIINVHGVIYHYCPHCGAKMDEKEK